MTRDEKIAEARRMRAEGEILRVIGDRFGVSPQTIMRWTDDDLADRDRAAARAQKLLYRGTCVDCGASTNGSAGPGKAGKRCSSCSYRAQHEAATWTPVRLVAEAHRWRDLTGAWPISTDWHSTVGGEAVRSEVRTIVLAFREATGPWPVTVTVTWKFGSWAAFMDACGGEAVGMGRPRDADRAARLARLRQATTRCAA